MNRSTDTRNDDYAMTMRQRLNAPKNVDRRLPGSMFRSTRNINPDRTIFKGTEDMAPFNDQLIQYNSTRPYRSPTQGAWKSSHYA